MCSHYKKMIHYKKVSHHIKIIYFSSVVDQEAFVTCATNDTYALGALVLGHSLRGVNTSRKIAVIITPHVSDKIR